MLLRGGSKRGSKSGRRGARRLEGSCGTGSALTGCRGGRRWPVARRCRVAGGGMWTGCCLGRWVQAGTGQGRRQAPRLHGVTCRNMQWNRARPACLFGITSGSCLWDLRLGPTCEGVEGESCRAPGGCARGGVRGEGTLWMVHSLSQVYDTRCRHVVCTLQFVPCRASLCVLAAHVQGLAGVALKLMWTLGGCRHVAFSGR